MQMIHLKKFFVSRITSHNFNIFNAKKNIDALTKNKPKINIKKFDLNLYFYYILLS